MHEKDFISNSSNTSFISKAKRTAARVLCGAAIALSPVAAHAAPELGVYRWDAPQGPANIDSFSQWLGRPATLGTAFEASATWADIEGAAWQLDPWSRWVKAKAGRNLSLAVPMLPKSGGSLASCSSGQYDGHWAKLANELSAYGLHWAYLRLGWEMDGTWYTWSAAQGSGKEASFAGCFRRIVQVMRQAQPANQWKFVLNPTIGWRDRSYLDAVWPGDAYVDVLAIDFYDQSWAANTYPYPSNCDAACRLTRQQNAWNDYSRLLYILRDYAVAHGKTVAFPEWGVAIRPDGHGGGDNPYYIRKMYEFIQDPANKVAFHTYWDVAASDLNAQLSGSTKFPQSAALFKQLFSAQPPNNANTPPAVSVTSPRAGQTVSGTLAYAANASDNAGVSRVEFFVDATALLSDTTAPYGGSLDTTKLANGMHVVKATAYDAQGLSATSQVAINVQNAGSAGGGTGGTTGGSTPAPTSGPLEIWFKAPLGGSTVSGVLNGGTGCYVKGFGVSRVAFSLDATALNTDTTMGDGMQCVLDTRRFSNGTHTLKATAFDASGKAYVETVSINIQNAGSTGGTTPAPGSGPLDIWFKAPLGGSTVSGVLNGGTGCYVKGFGVSRVAFSLDSTPLNTDTTMGDGMQCVLDTTRFSNGTHTLKATAFDASGKAYVETVRINIRN